MITGSPFSDGCAVLMVTLLLPLAMFAMRGQKKAQSKLAAAAFLAAAVSLFSMVILSMVVFSYHRLDYASAVQGSRSRGLLESQGCPDRNLTEGELLPGRGRILINIAGVATGIGWWTQALSSFSEQSGLVFDSGLVEKLDCHTDVFQMEDIAEEALLALPTCPHRASFIVRDPRGVVAETWLQERGKCGTDRRLADVCNATVEDGINNVIDLLREEGCSGRLAFLCAATGIAAQAAVRDGLKFFKYEMFWTGEATGLVQLARWYGLEGKQLQSFLSIGRIWTEEFHKMMETNPVATARKAGAWSQYFTKNNIQRFQEAFGSAAAELGYDDESD